MMTTSKGAIDDLIISGIIPKECFHFELLAKPCDVVRMRIEAYVNAAAGRVTPMREVDPTL